MINHYQCITCNTVSIGGNLLQEVVQDHNRGLIGIVCLWLLVQGETKTKSNLGS